MTTPKRPITPEDMAAFVRLADVQISPDGELVAFVAGEQFKVDTATPKSLIWIVPTAGGPARPFTGGPRTDNTPRWSPDGRTLAFLSDRLEDGRPQIYLLDRAGGEARRLSNLKGDICGLEWSPDSTRLAFLMTDPATEDEQRRKTAKDDPIEVEKNHKWQRVWTVDVVSGATRQITSGDAQVWEFSWTPDGGFALIVGPEPYEWSWFVARLARVGPRGGAPETLYSLPEKQFACPRVAPDGAQLAFLSCIWSDRGINGGDLFVLRLEARDLGLEEAGDLQGSSLKPQASQVRNLTQGYTGSIWWIQWTADGTALDYMAYEDGAAAIGRIDAATGTRVTCWRGGVGFVESFGACYIARDTGAIAVLREDAARPQDVWLALPMEDERWKTKDQHNQIAENDSSSILRAPSSVELDWKRLTCLHPQAAELALGETRVLRWRSADGMQIQGLLILPVGYQEGRRVPLVTWVHGGPAWLYSQGFYGAGRFPQQMFAGAGYAVLLANPRGSAGWGVAFTEANIGDFGGRDYQDIVAGIDYVISLGIAAPDRLAIGGWSYGGFMTAWAVTQTDRFKAAMMGAGICNWRSFHGVASIGMWDRISLRANPYEQGGCYDHFSPIHYVNNVKTPTLIVHGADDIIVPVGQSYEFFRALKDHGVPTELVVYPREPHSPAERAHNLDRFRRFLDWFQRYLC